MKTILSNGKIRLADDCYCEAVLIEDGLISRTGTDCEILKEKDENTVCYDLGGRLALPGFNDSHMHFVNVGFSFAQLDLRNTRSIAEVIEQGREYLQKNPPAAGKWVLAFGWNEDNWSDGRPLNRYDLDQITADYPLVAARVCTHATAVNSKALEQLGIYKGAPKPPAGEFQVDENGEPTGLLFEMFTQVSAALPEPTIDEIKQMILAMGRAAAARGLTSVQADDLESVPGNNFRNVITAFQELAAEGKLPVRVYEQCRLPDMASFRRFHEAGYRSGMGDDVFRLGPLKAFCDGSLGARTAWLKEDYSDDPGNRGIGIYNDDAELEELVQAVHDDGMSVAIHCIGDAAAEQAVTAIEKAIARNPQMKCRHGIVHAQILTPELIDRIKAAGIIAYIQPVFLEYDLHIAEDRVGSERLKYSYAFRQLYEKGIHVPFGTDSPVEDFDPLKNLYCAVTGQDFAGLPAGGWHPEKLFTLSQAVECYTQHSAYVSFDEDKKGLIRAGYFADITVLEKDIFEIPPAEIKDVKVYMTLMGGRVTYRREGKVSFDGCGLQKLDVSRDENLAELHALDNPLVFIKSRVPGHDIPDAAAEGGEELILRACKGGTVGLQYSPSLGQEYHAYPGEGYCFDGWYDVLGDRLSREAVWHDAYGTAREIFAMFAKA